MNNNVWFLSNQPILGRLLQVRLGTANASEMRIFGNGWCKIFYSLGQMSFLTKPTMSKD